jgi:hypothetical protein
LFFKAKPVVSQADGQMRLYKRAFVPRIGPAKFRTDRPQGVSNVDKRLSEPIRIRPERLPHQGLYPDLSRLRRILFWDTSPEEIGRVRQQRGVILRFLKEGMPAEAVIFWL